jgi:hypothetical protein
VPANRIGYSEFTAFQLKVIQEVITLCVFVVFAWSYLGETVNMESCCLVLVSARRCRVRILGKGVTVRRVRSAAVWSKDSEADTSLLATLLRCSSFPQNSKLELSDQQPCGSPCMGFRMMILIALYGAMFGILAYWRRSVRPGMIAHSGQNSLNGVLATVMRH